MRTVNLKFQTREKVNKMKSQSVDQFFSNPSSQNPVLESALRNAVIDLESYTGITSDQVLSRLSK